MALLELARAYLNKNDDFNLKIAGACLQASKDIDNESPTTDNHGNRATWASSIRQNPKTKAQEMLCDVLKNATIAADVDNATDSDIQFVVNGLIDTYAVGA